jgi:DNA-binding NarL/FixJ family response regulator
MKASVARVKVLLVDDHPVVRAGLASIISEERDLAVVGQATTYAEAITLFRKLSPDVVLVDLSLPDKSGIELVKELRRLSPRAHVIVLTVRTGSHDIRNALDAGAHSYVFKGAAHDELVTAIRLTAKGGRYISPALGDAVDQVRHEQPLTQRELQVLNWLVRGYSNQEIGRELDIAEETVKSHVKLILEKFCVDSRSKAIAYAVKNGFVHSEDL